MTNPRTDRVKNLTANNNFIAIKYVNYHCSRNFRCGVIEHIDFFVHHFQTLSPGFFCKELDFILLLIPTIETRPHKFKTILKFRSLFPICKIKVFNNVM